MKIRRELIWDYDLGEACPNEAFELLYVSRVLERGGDEDIREIGKEEIRARLPKLSLPASIRRFWEWYFNEGGFSGGTVKEADRSSPVSRPDRS